jgi:hypothetical protein
MRPAASLSLLIVPVAMAAARWDEAPLLPKPAAPTSEVAAAWSRSAGTVTVSNPVGTTGRYVVTFAGLSVPLAGRGVVQVAAIPTDDAHCKPVEAHLVTDTVEVQCFDSATRLPVNVGFTLAVRGGAQEVPREYAVTLSQAKRP